MRSTILVSGGVDDDRLPSSRPGQRPLHRAGRLSPQGVLPDRRRRQSAGRSVDDVSIELAEGEVLGIAGESGCGKSTLAMVLSLNIRRPLVVESGALSVAGKRIPFEQGAAVPEAFRGPLVSYLPQGAMNSLNPTMRVRDFVFDVLRSHHPRIKKKDAVARALGRLEQLGLPPRALDAYPHQLSGGMKQRVVTVISTLLNPKVLIADEPTSALDVSSQRALLAMLKQLLEGGIIGSIIFITHELLLLRYIAQRVAIMYAGQIVESGPTEQMIFEPQHPYTQALMEATLVLERSRRRERIRGIEGAPPDLTTPPHGCRFHPRCPVAMEVCKEKAPPPLAIQDHLVTCWQVYQPLERERYLGEPQP